MCLLAPGEQRYQGRTLQANFDELKGYSGDPAIQRFRDVGPDAVAFLARQMKRKASFLRDWYVALLAETASVRQIETQTTHDSGGNSH